MLSVISTINHVRLIIEYYRLNLHYILKIVSLGPIQNIFM